MFVVGDVVKYKGSFRLGLTPESYVVTDVRTEGVDQIITLDNLIEVYAKDYYLYTGYNKKAE